MFSKTKIFIVAFFVVIISFLVAGALQQPSRMEPRQLGESTTIYPTPLVGLLAQCGGIFNFTSGNIGTVNPDYDRSVPVLSVSVPAYGYMTETPFEETDVKAYPKDFEGFNLGKIHRALWQGYGIVWADSNVEDEAYEFVTDYVNDWNATHEDALILLPWPDEANNPIPGGRDFAFSSWGYSQSCSSFSPEVHELFITAAKDVPARDRLNPPEATYDNQGNLLPIF